MITEWVNFAVPNGRQSHQCHVETVEGRPAFDYYKPDSTDQ